jgi:hypothetical protein
VWGLIGSGMGFCERYILGGGFPVFFAACKHTHLDAEMQ